MNIRKSAVNEFFQKVKGKAFETVMNKHSSEREAFAKRYMSELRDVRIASALTRADTSITELCDSLKIIKEVFGGYDYLLHFSYPHKSCREIFFSYPVKNCPESVEMFKRHSEELKELKDNYDKIEQNLSVLKKGKEAMEYLRSLGFDVAYIEKVSEKSYSEQVLQTGIDTEKIFPCKQRGID